MQLDVALTSKVIGCDLTDCSGMWRSGCNKYELMDSFECRFGVVCGKKFWNWSNYRAVLRSLEILQIGKREAERD